MLVIESFRLSPQQERLWHLGASSVFRAQCAVNLVGPLDRAVLAKSIRGVVRRHEILRTRFGLFGGKLAAQAPGEGDDRTWAELDLHAANPDDAAARIARAYATQAETPPDLIAGAMLDVHLVILAEDRHELLLRLPSLCADRRSLRNLVLAVARSYQAAIRGGGAEDQAVAMQYIEIAQWQAELLESAGGDSERRLWQERGQAVRDLRLPIGDSSSPEVEFHPELTTFELGKDRMAGLCALADRIGIPISALFLATFSALLARLEESGTAALGVVVEGRTFDDLVEALGPFSKSLPLIFGTEQGTLPFDRFAQRVWKDMEEAAAIQEFHEPAFLPLRFEWVEEPPQAIVAGVTFVIDRESVITDRFVLQLSCHGDSRGYVELSFDPSRLDPTEAERLIERFRSLFDSALAEPLKPLRELNAVGDIERAFLLGGLNPERIVYPEADRCLHELFEEQVRRSPGAPALVFGGISLTYAELDARSSDLAARLAKLGAGPEVLVGICMERSLELVIGLLGILKAGAAYVPLEPSYPKDRLEAMVEDLAATGSLPLIVTRESHLAAIPERVQADSGRILLLSAEEPVDQERPQSVRMNPGHLAYSIFTSGSTGRPKGAMNSHRGVVNRLIWMQQVYGLSPKDRVLQKTPFSFDVSVWEFFWPLICGATLVVAEPDRHKDSSYLVRTLCEERITTVHFVPSLLRIFLEESTVASCGSLRRVLCSGEALPPDLVNRFFDCFRGEQAPELHNLYGPTEAAVDVTWWRCTPGEEVTPIGTPVANTCIYLLDPPAMALRPVPFGAPGEVCIGGVQVGRGYLGRPGLTAERFLPDPFSREPGDRLYRTGDVARYLRNGAILYLGRLDDQVKIRGVRIELGEIESVLRRHEGVLDAAVVTRDVAPGDRRLVAYAVTRETTAPTLGELRSYLERLLPRAMVPSQVVRLAALPLTPSGKVNRRALPLPEPERPELDVAFVAPRTPAEKLLAGIWADLLRVSDIGVFDDFFQLGGDSILAVQAASRANRAGLRQLPMQVFRHPTIAALAAQSEARETPEAAAVPVAQDARIPEAVAGQLGAKAEIAGAYPLSPIQQGILFHSVERQDPNRYILQISSLLEGELNVAALRASWRLLVARHSIFRTAFLWEGLEEPVQVVLVHVETLFGNVDLCALDPAVRDRAIDDWLEADRAEGFDFRVAPLIRLALFHRGEGSYQFVWTFHHLIMDGWSERVVLDELNRLYSDFCRGSVIELDPAPQFDSYIEWLRRRDLASAEAFWREELQGFSGPTPLEVPGDGVIETGEGMGVEVRQLLWSAEETGALRSFAQDSRLTLNTLVQGAWALLLGVASSRRDVVFGATVSGRPADLSGVESIVGPFLNTLPVRLRWQPEEYLLPWLSEVQNHFAELRSYEFSPLVAIQSWSQVTRGLPVFESLVGFQNRPLLPEGEPKQAADGYAVRSRGYRGGRNNFPLGLEVDPGPRLNLMLAYDRARFRAAGIELRLKSCATLLAAFIAQPDATLSSLETSLEGSLRQWREEDDRLREQRNVQNLRFARRRVSS